MYEEKFFITSNDVDDHYELKITSLFKYLQQVSTNHAEIIGFGKKDTVDKGMFWVITRMKVVIHRLPKMLETIKVTTHPGETQIFIFPRHYQIYDENNNLIVTASSSWAVLDLETHKVKVNPFGNLQIPFERIDEDISLPSKVIGECHRLIEKRKVRYSDIDLNGHLNNTKYIEYMIDTHDQDFYNKYQVKEITINYEKEVRNTDTVTLFTNDEIPETIIGEVDGVRAFITKIEYQNR